MDKHLLTIVIISLFFVSTVFLTLKHDALLYEADQAFVSLSYLHPEDPRDATFVISHTAENVRTGALDYHYSDQKIQSETITLAPHEQKKFSPSPAPLSITFRYQDQQNQEHALTLYKK